MKRVKVYRPKMHREQQKIDGRLVTITVIDDPRHELISERGVMDRTYAEYENAGEFIDEVIAANNMFMEEVKPEAKPEPEAEDKPKRGRKKKVEDE